MFLKGLLLVVSKDLRPLGSLQRVRRALYAASAKRRDASPEPDGTEKFD